VRHLKPAEKRTEAMVLVSHEQQLERKEDALSRAREAEAQQHVDTLQRLKGEMLMDYELTAARRSANRQLAEQLKQQHAEKFERDFIGREVIGMNHWPFRTEAEVRAAMAATNMKQKDELDRQLAEKREKREFMEKVMAKQAVAEEEAAARQAQLAKEEAMHRAQTIAATQKSVERTMDDAYKRFESYLDHRKTAIGHSKSYMKEQRHLSEQSELLKQEEQRRRLLEMRAYLDAQVDTKKAAVDREKRLLKTEVPISDPATLPMGIEPDAEEEAYVKMALRQALDHQVDSKYKHKAQSKADEKQQEQYTLSCVAREMQQARFRDLEAKRDRAQMLTSTWEKQNSLKRYERKLDAEYK